MSAFWDAQTSGGYGTSDFDFSGSLNSLTNSVLSVIGARNAVSAAWNGTNNSAPQPVAQTQQQASMPVWVWLIGAVLVYKVVK